MATTVERATWAFRNVTRSFDFWPTLESVSIEDAHPEEQATFSCRVEDVGASITFENEDTVRVSFGGVKIFEGRVKQCILTDHGRSIPRAYELTCNDWTVLLGEDIIDQKGVRGSESAAARIAWILGFSSKGLTLDPSAQIPATTVDKAEYFGQNLQEALEGTLGQIDTANVLYYVDFDKVVHVFSTDFPSAPFALDTSPSPPTSYPYWDWSHTYDTAELGNAAMVIGDKGEGFVTDSGSITTWGRREFTVEDSELKTSTARTRAGRHALSNQAQPIIDGACTIPRAGLRAGMTVNVTHDSWAQVAAANPYIVKSVSITAVDPHDDDTQAEVRVEIRYTDRYRLKFKPGKGGPRPPDADQEDEDTLSSSIVVRQAEEEWDTFVDDSLYSDTYGNPALKYAGQGVYHNIPYTTCGCPLGAGGWSGVAYMEFWIEASVPALDDEVVGVNVSIEMLSTSFYFGRTQGPWQYGVKDTAPTGVRQGTKLGHVDLPASGTAKFFVPRAHLNEGSTNYFYVGPDWPGIVGGGFFCSQDLATPSHGPMGHPDSGGEGASGKIQFPGASSVSLTAVAQRRRGMTNWVPGIGEVDGSNSTFELLNWTGRGVPMARVGAVILATSDYTYDVDAGTVTLDVAPDEGDRVAFQYESAGASA